MPSFSVLICCLLGFIRGLSKAFSSGLPPEKPHKALSPGCGRPGAHITQRSKGSTVVSFCKIPQRALLHRCFSNSSFSEVPDSSPPCGKSWFTSIFQRTLQETHPILMLAALSNLKACASSRGVYAFLFAWYALLVRDTLSSNSDPWSKKPSTTSSTSSAAMLGSMYAISTWILGMGWRTAQLASITSLKAVSDRPLPSLEHFSSTSRSLMRVSLILWTVMPSSSGLARSLRS